MAAPVWASLEEASEMVRATGIDDPAKTIRRTVSAALLVSAAPTPDHEPSALRVRVISQRKMVGLDWLQAPELDFEKSEILCRSFMPGSWEQFEIPGLHPAKIELWTADVKRLWPPSAAMIRKGGRPPVVEWGLVETEAIRLMEDNGEFSAVDGWNAQERLNEELMKFCQDKFGIEPGLSTLKEHVGPCLTEWRASKSAGN
jgi:hypothetical protein